MIRVEHDWWKTLFDEVYLVTDAPFVCNPALTKREVDVIENALGLYPAAHILDVCGGQGVMPWSWRGAAISISQSWTIRTFCSTGGVGKPPPRVST